MTKVSFFTLGCRANQAETAVLEDLFREKGFIVVKEGVSADIAVINSCTVTGEGDREALRIINKACRLNPGVRVAVIGCQAQVQKEAVLRMPNVHWAVGTARKMCLADIILEDVRGLIVPPIRVEAFTMPIVGVNRGRTRANLKIQDGCDNFCAYCEVPFARGRARSRVFADVMAAAQAFVAAGHQEIVLTGINVGLYAHEGKTLIDLVAGVEKITGLVRLRLSSIEYAGWISALARFMQPGHKLCRHLHLPLQSGCDRVLSRMGRRYSCEDIKVLLGEFYRNVPGIMLGTDVIAGFPGETEKDFETTCRFLREQPFHYFHVFSYSDRHRARSRSFRGAVPQREISERAARLRALSVLKRKDFLAALVGSSQNVLFEHKKDAHWFGHTDNYVTIKTISNKNIHNKILRVNVLGLDGETAIGEI